MENILRVPEALEALKKAGFATRWIECVDAVGKIEVEKEGVYLYIPVLTIDGVERVCDPTRCPLSLVDELINLCEAAIYLM